MNITRTTLRSLILGGVLAVAAAAPAFALDGLDFRLHNDSNKEITGFFINPVGTDNWIALRGRTLAPGDWTTVSVSGSYDNCYYNMVAHYADGSSAAERSVNLCRTVDVYA